MSRHIGFIAIPLLLGACATPVGPKSWTGAPAVAGRIRVDGIPVPGMKVRLVKGLDHEDRPKPDAKVAETSSDADGRFSLGPLGKKSHAAYIGFWGLGESIANWGIQFQQDGQWLTGWSSHKTIGYAPRDPVRADCNLARPAADDVIQGAGRGTRGKGFCTLELVAAKIR